VLLSRSNVSVKLRAGLARPWLDQCTPVGAQSWAGIVDLCGAIAAVRGVPRRTVSFNRWLDGSLPAKKIRVENLELTLKLATREVRLPIVDRNHAMPHRKYARQQTPKPGESSIACLTERNCQDLVGYVWNPEETVVKPLDLERSAFHGRDRAASCAHIRPSHR